MRQIHVETTMVARSVPEGRLQRGDVGSVGVDPGSRGSGVVGDERRSAQSSVGAGLSGDVSAAMTPKRHRAVPSVNRDPLYT